MPVTTDSVFVTNGGTPQITALTGSVPATGSLSNITVRTGNSKIVQSGGSVAGVSAFVGGATGGTYELQGGSLSLSQATNGLDISAPNTGGQLGYFIQSGGTATVGGVRMSSKGSGLAEMRVSDGRMTITNSLSMQGGPNELTLVTQSGGTVTIGSQLQMSQGAVSSGTAATIVNLDGGTMTIAGATPISSTGGPNNYFDFDGGSLNLKGTWDFASLTGIANSDFRVQGVAATSGDLVFDPITINSVAYTRVMLGTYRVGGSGETVDVQSQITGAANAVVVGGTAGLGGTVIFSNTNTYTGDTTIAGGTLKLGANGSLASSPTIIVGDAASNGVILDLTDKTAFSISGSQMLTGKGTVLLGETTALTVNGLFSPGNSPGLFTYDGGGTATLAGTTLMEITGTTRGTTYDAVDVLGGTELSFGNGSILQLDFSQTFADGTVFNLFTPDGTSSLAGTFSEISMVGIAYGDLTFTQVGTSGIWNTNVDDNQSMTFNSAAGTLSIVPEPALLGLLASAAAAGWGVWKRRQTRRGTADHGNA